MKVEITTDDVFINRIRTKEECDELFGEDYFDEYAIEVPDDLAKEAIEIYEKMRVISLKLGEIKKIERGRWGE
jgi:hypothetical protein